MLFYKDIVNSGDSIISIFFQILESILNCGFHDFPITCGIKPFANKGIHFYSSLQVVAF